MTDTPIACLACFEDHELSHHRGGERCHAVQVVGRGANVRDGEERPRGEIPAGAKVLYAHLGGVPALNGYGYTYRNG